MGRLDGKVALITGAGGGMGRVATRAFVREGARVVASDVRAAAAEETVAGLDGQAVAVAGGVSQEFDVQRMGATAGRRVCHPHGLSHNTGIFYAAHASGL